MFLVIVKCQFRGLWFQFSCLKCLYGQQGFYSYGSSILCKKVFKEKKLDKRSSLKVPASATPNKVDRESVRKRVWVSEWVVTSSQESQNPSSLGNCCFSSGEEFSSTKNKQIEVGKAMRSSRKQKKSIEHWEVTSFVTNLSLRGQLHWAWPRREI